MPVHVSFHSSKAGDSAYSTAGVRGSADLSAPVLTPKIGNSVQLAVGAAAEAVPTDQTQAYFARIVATEACRVDILSTGNANATTSEYWPAGHVDVRYVKKGQKVAVIAAA